ncbi:flavin containing amine oxidoreductase [Zalerion maritima]|uniref:Flavin containing amine oxidoreductase n=1 Tax=Zalerion maritima TaxID=339359 RepID=A0AAD5RN89_9PEZI|nr:flavin containing amine oxidoreductase [Zalerion maritima]
MDAYSISFTSPALRSTSRIYQDLNTCRPSANTTTRAALPRPAATMDTLQKARIHKPAEATHVAVVGAGLAGLRCADVLMQNGFKVTILEGRNRVGGRVFQEKLPNGHMADLGPNWIHGTVDNPINDIAKQTGTITSSWGHNPHIFDEDGKLFDAKEAAQLSDIMWDIVLKAFQFSNKNCAATDSKESLYDFFVSNSEIVIPNATTPEGQEEVLRKRKILLQMCEMWGAFVGEAIFSQSLKFFWLEECLEGENLLCAGTYSKILDVVSKHAMEGAEIKYNTVVERICTRSNSRDKVRLATSNGTLEFDEVVLTTPLGWLKRNLSAFEPALPARLSKAINSLGYGCLEKVYITFPSAFWATPGKDGRKLEGFGQWISPSYAADTNPSKWNQEVVELASLPDGTNHPTLLFYAFGDESKHITSTLLAPSTQDRKNAFVYDFFRPYFSRLPNYDASKPECRPTGFLHTDWLHDDLAGNGSYSNFQTGLDEGDKDIEAMREGVPARGLWLAGEHTAPFVASGTSTGAYWSGELVAKRIAEQYGKEPRRKN